jgi:N-6 DNA Methylase
MPELPDTPVSLAEIARIAGVGRAAVSNWRRRHPTFPSRVGGTDSSPLFSLAAVEVWLNEQGKLRASSTSGLERLWPQFDVLGDRAESGLAIAASALSVRPARSSAFPSSGIKLSAPAMQLVDQTVDLAKRAGAQETFEFLLGRWQDTNVRQVTVTPVPLARLMALIANSLGGAPESNQRVVLDPACGTGALLSAAAGVMQGEQHDLKSIVLAGVDREAEMAALTAARLSFLQPVGAENGAQASDVALDVRVGDSLRADPLKDLRADVVLCNPPYSDRDWGYEELATDSRWTFGLPPRTESELAWVQHVVSKLVPGGTAVIVLPPAVAARKAGRRIRGELARTGVLKAVVALPAGSAPPYSVPLHLWVLQAVGGENRAPDAGQTLLLVDAGDFGEPSAKTDQGGIDWDSLHDAVFEAVVGAGSGVLEASGHGRAGSPVRSARVPLIDVLDDVVDLTPARHVPADGRLSPVALADSWTRFAGLLGELEAARRSLSKIEFEALGSAPIGMTTVGELVRAGVLQVKAGQLPPEGSIRLGDRAEGTVPVLTMSDLLMDGKPSGWLPLEEVAGSDLVTSARDDVVVGGLSRGFFAWVEEGPATVLSAQIHALSVNGSAIDPWFLAGCLRAPANVRQAGTHASSSARVDVRKLLVRQIPLDQQRRYGEVFHEIARLEASVREIGLLTDALAVDLSDGLISGQMRPSSL